MRATASDRERLGSIRSSAEPGHVRQHPLLFQGKVGLQVALRCRLPSRHGREGDRLDVGGGKGRVQRDGPVQRIECLLRLHTEQVADPVPGAAKLVPDLGVIGKPAVGQLQNRDHPLTLALGLDVQRRSVADRGEDGIGCDHQALPRRQAPVQRAGPERVRPHHGVGPSGALVEPGLEDPVEGEGEGRIQTGGALEVPPRRIPLGPTEILLPLQVRLERGE